jgi:hypothetical protein
MRKSYLGRLIKSLPKNKKIFKKGIDNLQKVCYNKGTKNKERGNEK